MSEPADLLKTDAGHDVGKADGERALPLRREMEQLGLQFGILSGLGKESLGELPGAG